MNWDVLCLLMNEDASASTLQHYPSLDIKQILDTAARERVKTAGGAVCFRIQRSCLKFSFAIY